MASPCLADLDTTVQKNEITPGFALAEYARRRSKLMEALPPSSMVVAVSAPVKYMSGGEHHQSNRYSLHGVLALTSISYHRDLVSKSARAFSMCGSVNG